ELGVVPLNARRIHEHDRRQIARGERAINISRVALPAKVGEVAAMINVRVAQHHRVERFGVEGEIAIALDGFLALALKEAALQQQPRAVDFEQIHRAGRRARGAEEMDLHGAKGAGGGRVVESGNGKLNPLHSKGQISRFLERVYFASFEQLRLL